MAPAVGQAMTATDDQEWASETTTLVDREEETGVLRRCVADLLDGRSASVTLAGPRGLGHSSLIDFVAGHASAKGLAVAAVRCLPTETGLAFGVVHRITDTLARTCGMAGLSRWPVAEGSIPALSADFLAVRPTQALVVAVDDAQWADKESRLWLSAVTCRSGQAPVLLVQATAYIDLGPPYVPPSSLPTRVLQLRPFDEQGVHEFIAARYHEPADSAFVAEATAVTSGGPAVLDRVFRRFARDGLALNAANRQFLSRFVDAVLGERAADVLPALPADALELLRGLALCGDTLGVELTCSLITPTVMSPVAALRLLRGLGLLDGDDEPLPPPSVRIRALAGVTAEKRDTVLNRAVGLARQAAVPDDRLAALLLTAPSVRADWAADVLVRVARRKRAEGDYRAAAELFTRALREPAGSVPRQQLMLDLAAVDVVHNPHGADRGLRQMLLDIDTDDPLALRAADLLQVRGDAPTTRRVIATVRARGEAAGTRPGALPAIGWLAENDCVPDSAHSAQVFPDPLAEVRDPVHAGVGAWALTLRGENRERAQSLARECLRAMSTTADDPAPFAARIHACRALLHTDDIAGAVQGLDMLVAYARRYGLPAVAAMALLHRGWCEQRRGDLAKAEEDLRSAQVQLPPRSWHPRTRPALTALTALLHLRRGEVEEADSVASAEQSESPDQAAAWGMLECVRGAIALELGDPWRAARSLQTSGEIMLAHGWVNPSLVAWRSLEAAAHAACGDLGTAHVRSTEASDLATKWGAPTALAQVALWAVWTRRLGQIETVGDALSIAGQQVDVLVGAGRSVDDIARLLEVSGPSAPRWLASHLQASVSGPAEIGRRC